MNRKALLSIIMGLSISAPIMTGASIAAEVEAKEAAPDKLIASERASSTVGENPNSDGCVSAEYKTDEQKGSREKSADSYESDGNLHTIVSPLWGVFYHTHPNPIRVGSHLPRWGEVGFVEAMKMMHISRTDISGQVIDVFVENGQNVVPGQPLFIVRR